MNETDGNNSAVATRLSKGYAYAFLFLTFFVYPLALLPQVMRIGRWYNNLSFQVSVPAFLILGFLALPVIIANRWRVPLSIAFGLIIYLLFWFINVPSLKEYWDEFATLLGCITIPLAAAILREQKVLSTWNISYTALGVWGVQLALGVISLIRHQPVVGTPGNINWMAALLLLLSPWVFVALKDVATYLYKKKRLILVVYGLTVTVLLFLSPMVLSVSQLCAGWLEKNSSLWLATFLLKIIKEGILGYSISSAIWWRLVLGSLCLVSIFNVWSLRKIASDRKLQVGFALVVLGVPTIILLYHCHSRAAWVALFAAPLVLVFLVLKTRLEKALYGGLLLTLVVGSVLIGYRVVPGRLLRIVEQDVRLPLWTGTVGMMLKNPWGVGSGEFQRKFTPYRVGTYHSRLYAADMTIHPHNELLNVSSQLGIPVFLALLLLVSPLIRGNFNSPLVNCARLSALFVVFQSSFDMPLVQPPVSFLGFFMIGLCWPLNLKSETEMGAVRKTGALLAVLPVIGVVGYFCWYDLRSDITIREATMLKHRAQQTVQEGNKFRQNKKLFSQFQADAGKHYDEAKRLFELAVTPHRSLKANYEAALVALNVQQNAANAEELLDHVTRIDPDYAHINLLLGRLSLLKQDLQKANYYFARECMLYPRNSDAWQTMYNFSFRSGQYNRCLEIQEELDTIYSERIRLVFPGRQLDGERTTLLEHLADNSKKKETLSRANGFMVKVNQKTMDPLFVDLAMGEDWPAKLLGDDFDELDYLFWMGRLEKWKKIKSFDQKPSIPEFVSWYCKHITDRERKGFELPLTVEKNQKGNLLSRYSNFSDYVNILGGQCVLVFDSEKKPLFAWVFEGEVKSIKFAPSSRQKIEFIKLDFSDIKVFKVDLSKSRSEPRTLDEVKTEFSWTPNRTVVYFAPEEYFMRTQVLASMLGNDYDFLDKRPPSLRLLELFWITGKSPPVPTSIHTYCFQPVLDLYKGFYEQARERLEGK